MNQTFFVAITLALAFYGSLESKPKENTKETIHAHELNTNYEIIGPLGESLGKLLNIEAKIIDTKRKANPIQLEVTRIDNKQLELPVQIPYTFFPPSKNLKELEEGKTYQLRVYQDGGMVGIPQQVLKETSPATSVDYHFATWAVIIKVIPLENEETP